MDVNNAFLQGHLQEDVYMVHPLAFVDKERPHFVCKLHKAIYGLKQAPRVWYHELHSFLINNDFTNSVNDTSLFILKHHGHLLYLLVYVDDIIITGDDEHAVDLLVKLSQVVLTEGSRVSNLFPWCGNSIPSSQVGAFSAQIYSGSLASYQHEQLTACGYSTSTRSSSHSYNG